jgi:hypothetical protein
LHPAPRTPGAHRLKTKPAPAPPLTALQGEFEEAAYGVLVSFEAGQLLAGDAAEAHLRRFQPRLCGRDAVVNVGAMRVEGLPRWFAGG